MLRPGEQSQQSEAAGEAWWVPTLNLLPAGTGCRGRTPALGAERERQKLIQAPWTRTRIAGGAEACGPLVAVFGSD
ncbi:hypothetical protein NDU88_010107 [Pleurodeles waltl]|uniref:Uncharacterized protein n=1 Tax=Pleurodeles waltl TaxID=8319 RepID=A0AAV7RX74_PLEWA|nr:hypothetical protein NDU88_010107 [Pleurodeles waltl]